MDPMNQDEIVPSAPNRAARRARKVGAALGATGIASGTAAAVVGLLAAPAGALATWTVNQGGDAGNGDCDDTTCTLRDAIEESNNDGEASAIVFDASVTGEIVLTAGQLLVNESFDLTVTGPGAGVLSVNGGGNDRVFYATTGFNGSTLTISGLTITGGNPDSGIKGGGILMYGDDGGSNLVLDSMVVTGNVAPYYGGGVAFAKDNNMTVTNSRITDNHTLYFDGGGIHFEDGLALTITNSEISGNRAGIEEGGSGGGIFVGVSQQSEPQPDIVIANSTIANNTAGLPGDFGNGGGIAVEQGNLTLLQTTISGNDAAELGDGLYLNTPFGAGVEAADKTVPRPANLPPKDAAADVGALEVGTVTVIGTIISANPGTDIDTGGTGAAIDSTNNLIGTIGATILINNLGGTIFSSTPGLGALANNGGFTQTMALQPGSVAINAGPDPVPAFAGNEFDQRGADFFRVVNGRVDIGAYEVQAIVVEPTFTG